MPDALRPLSHRSGRIVAAVALVVALLTSAAPAAGVADDARKERAAVQAEKAQAAAQVNALKGDQAEVQAALAAIDEHVRAEEAEAVIAGQVAAAAAEEAATARRAADASAAELEQLRRRLTEYAVSAYVDPPGEDVLRRLQAGSAQEDATRRAWISMRSGHDVDLADRVRAVQRRHEDDVARADATRAAAEETKARAEASVATLTAAREQQAQFAEQVRQRLDARLADVAALERLDASLAARIRSEEERVAAALRALAPAKPPAPTRGSGGASGGGASGGSGSSSGGSGSSSGGSGSSAQRPSAPPLRTVGGITVNAAIADQLSALLAAARADGIAFGGSGYRDITNQLYLRRQNCGTSDYAVYEMPPDQCSPPTARPGLSMHERGLAIDFTANGRFLSSRSDPGFVWLAANAARFGFYNLPSEPWHWSTTGG
jgi:hypothetical protein